MGTIVGLPDIVEAEGNEALLDQVLDAVLTGTCSPQKSEQGWPQLPGGKTMPLAVLVEYFLATRPFDLKLYTHFSETLRQLFGFGFISFELGQWVEREVRDGFFISPTAEKQRAEADTMGEADCFFASSDSGLWRDLRLKPDADIAKIMPGMLSFVCYLAVCHLKYGARYERVTAERYFDLVARLGSDEVARLKQEGTGALPRDVTAYKDADLSCVANDVFATIKITMKTDTEDAYRNALNFINRLLATGDFPKSYDIVFSGGGKHVLSVKGLPKCGAHALFAGAVRFPALHGLMAEYAQQAMRKYEWYLGLEGEDGAMPSTFAVYALALADAQYFDLLCRYLDLCDDGHSLIQQKFTPALVEKYGITEQSMPVFIASVLSMQEHAPHQVLRKAFADPKALELLSHRRAGLDDYSWQSICYAIWGGDSPWDQQAALKKLLKISTPEMRLLYEKVLA